MWQWTARQPESHKYRAVIEMKVSELIEILKKCPQDVEVISHADNHTALHGGRCKLRVALMETYAGPRICIGNMTRRNVDCRNEFIVNELDGKGELPDNWLTP